MNGLRKAAVLLLTLEKDVAARIMRLLDRDTVEDITREIASLEDLDADVRDDVVEEFYNLALARQYASQGGLTYARTLLEQSMNKDDAGRIIDMIEHQVHKQPFTFLAKADPEELLTFIQDEHPQTIALILAHLEDPEQTATVLKELPENLQADVVYRMAILESIQPGVVSEIDEVLSREMQASGAMGTSKVGGIEAVAEMLNSLDKSTETRILATIEESNPDLAEQIRELMFTFEDMVLIDSRGMQQILKEMPQDELTMALKTASDSIKELIFQSMSQRAAEMLREDLEVLGPVKVSDVERSQQAMVKISRRLEEEGKVVIGGRGGDVI